MAAKMADFLQKNVYLYISVYIEAIFQILVANVMFWNKAQTRVSPLKRWDCFWHVYIQNGGQNGGLNIKYLYLSF